MNSKIPGPDFYADFSRFSELRNIARNNSDQGIQHVAEQFESLFMQMMLKSMRQASFGGGLLDSDQSEFYRDLHDKQLSLQLAKTSSLGIAKLLSRQLGGSDQTEQTLTGKGLEEYGNHRIQSAPKTAIQNQERPVSSSENIDSKIFELKINSIEPIKTPQEFIQRFIPYAKQAAADLGVDPKLLLAQAALETGWGSAVVRHQDGSTSHNLFGIKADDRWSGERVGVTTLEYTDGVQEKRHANFRSYSNFQESFDDFVDFLKNNPRYEQALTKVGNASKFIKALQDAGYATDPDYATKVIGIYNRDELAGV